MWIDAVANTIYPLYKQALLDGDSNIDLNDGTVKVALVDTGTYTYSDAHDFLNDLSGTIGTAGTIANTTVTNGLFDGDDATITGVPASQTGEALVIYIDTGSSATSRLVAYLDTGMPAMPITTTGVNVLITWNASGIFQL